MTNVSVSTQGVAENSQEALEVLNRIADKMRAECSTDLPREYFLREARSRLSRADGDQSSKDEKYWSSACFDAWAKG